MNVSARNVFEGKITKLTAGPVSALVELSTPGGDRIVAVITESSVAELGLAVGKPAVAYVKAPWVMVLTPGVEEIRFSARNQLAGTVISLQKGVVNTDVAIRLPGGSEVHAIVTNDAVLELGLKEGGAATALIKASHVVLGVPA